jgi:hypothetical protein
MKITIIVESENFKVGDEGPIKVELTGSILKAEAAHTMVDRAMAALKLEEVNR